MTPENCSGGRNEVKNDNCCASAIALKRFAEIANPHGEFVNLLGRYSPEQVMGIVKMYESTDDHQLPRLAQIIGVCSLDNADLFLDFLAKLEQEGCTKEFFAVLSTSSVKDILAAVKARTEIKARNRKYYEEHREALNRKRGINAKKRREKEKEIGVGTFPRLLGCCS